jgi:hypothetical protein
MKSIMAESSTSKVRRLPYKELADCRHFGYLDRAIFHAVALVQKVG